MKKSVNAKLLKDVTVNGNEKLLLSVYIKKQSIMETDSLKNLTGCVSRNDVIEKAIEFYFGYVTSQLSQDFLCGAFGSKMEGLVSNLATRISRGNFRNAVEIDLLTRVVATAVQVNKTEYEKLRIKSVRDVKSLNGSIDIFDVANEMEDVN